MTWRILHVDDEADIREIVQLALELDPRFEVHSAASGSMAIDLLAEFRPDLIMLDMMMPKMDGPATMAALTARGLADCPVVFVTARVMSEDLNELTRLGAAGMIAKPFDPLMLAEQVAGFLV